MVRVVGRHYSIRGMNTGKPRRRPEKIENLTSKTLIHTSKYGSWLPIGDHQGAGLPRNMPASHASNPFRLTFLDSRARFPMSHGRMIICSEI